MATIHSSENLGYTRTLTFIVLYCTTHFAAASGFGETYNPTTSSYRGAFKYNPKPNVIIIVADDLGFNDVSFHGSDQILTPNIDALAYNGIMLNKHYTPALCTPSRAALMTGKYPINIGMQHYVIPNDEPWGLPLKETIMPEILKEAGYSTYIVGKWHLGFHRKDFTPTKRGFDYHFGYYGGYIDYYNHYLEMIGKPYAPGKDMRRNLEPIGNLTAGRYATDLFTEEAIDVIHQHDQRKPMFLYLPHLAPHTGNEDNPLQAPPENIAKFAHIKDPKRRTYAAMIDKLDESIGKVFQALYETRMLQNSIVLFYADNGGPSQGLHSNRASNFPFRGQKDSPWEGGLRTAATIWSPYLLQQHQTVSDTLIHVSDWLPTIAASAGLDISGPLSLDGKNIWDALQYGHDSPRWNILHNIDEITGYSSYSTRRWKLVNGTTGPNYNGWLGAIPNEADPRAKNYASTILASPVNQIMQQINAEMYAKNLTHEKILSLRKQARVECPDLNLVDSVCNPEQRPCLFDILNDPCERYNVADSFPQVLDRLASDVEYFRLHAAKPVRTKADPQCNPLFYNLTWTWWKDITDGAHSSSFDLDKFADTDKGSQDVWYEWWNL